MSSCSINYRKQIEDQVQEQLDIGTPESDINRAFKSDIYGKVVEDGVITVPTSLIEAYEQKYNKVVLPEDDFSEELSRDLESAITTEEGIKVVQDTETYSDIDKKELKDWFNQLSSTQKEAYTYFMQYLNELNLDFDVQVVNGLSENAIVDLTKGIISLNENASFEDFTEEVFHILEQLLPSHIKEPLLKNITATDTFKEVYDLYKDDPDFQKDGVVDIDKIKSEALVKMLNQYSKGVDINKLTSNSPAAYRTFLDRILDFIKNLFRLVETKDLENLAHAILNKDVKFVQKDFHGIFKSKKVLRDYTIKGLNYNLQDNNVKEVYLSWENLFVEKLQHNNTNKFVPTNLYYELLNLGQKLEEVESGYTAKVFVQTYGMPSNPEINNYLGNINDMAYLKIGEYPMYLTPDRQLAIDPTGKTKYQVLLTKRDASGLPVINESTISFKHIGAGATRLVYEEVVELTPDPTDPTLFIPTTKQVLLDRENTNSLNSTLVEDVSAPIPKIDIIRSKNVITEEVRKYFEDLLGRAVTDESAADFLEVFMESVKELDKNIEMIERSGVNSFYTNIKDKVVITKNLATQLSRIDNISEFIEKVEIFYAYMENVQQVMDKLNHMFKNEDLSLVFQDEPLVKLNQIFRLVTIWTKITDGLEGQLVELDKNGYSNFTAKLALFSQTVKQVNKNLFKAIEGTVANQMADTIEADFNRSLLHNIEALENELAEVYKNISNVDEQQKAMRAGAARLVELRAQFDKQKIQRQDVIDILKGKKGDLEDLGGKMKAIFDSYAVGARYANDPIVATFAKMIDSVNFEASVETQDTISNYLDLSELIKKLGGEIEAGKKLSTQIEVTSFEDVRVDGKVFKKKITRTEKRFYNPYGDYSNWDLSSIINITGVTSYNELMALQSNVENALLYGDPGNPDLFFGNGTPLVPTQDLLKEILEAKKRLREQVFYRKYCEPFYQVKTTVVDNYLSRGLIGRTTLESLLELADETIQKKYDEISSLRPLLLTASYEDFIDIRVQIANLYKDIANLHNPAMYSANSDEFHVATVLKEIREQRKNYRKNTDNLEDFIGDLLVVINSITSKDVKDEIQDIVFDAFGSVKSNVKEALAEYLLKKTNQTTFEEEVTEETQKVLDFLDDAITYNPSETFYSKRDSYIKTISFAIAAINPLDYVCSVNGNTVIDFKVQGMDSNDILLTGYLNNPSFTTIQAGKEWAVANGEDYFVYSTTVSDRKGNDLAVKYLMNKKGNFVKLTKGDPTNKDIADKWEEIFEITKKYKDSNGFTYRVTKEDQALITQRESEIEAIKQALMSAPASKTGIKTDYKKYKKMIETYSQLLEGLQLDFYTEEYYNELRERIVGSSNSFEVGSGLSTFSSAYTELIKAARSNNAIKFKNIWKVVRSQLFATNDIFRATHVFDGGKWRIMTLEEIKKQKGFLQIPSQVKVPIAALTQTDLDFFSWVYRNHLVKLKSGKGVLTPAYHHRKYVPQDTQDLDVRLSYKYFDTSIKDDYLSERFYAGQVGSNGMPVKVKNTRGQYMPKRFDLHANQDVLIDGFNNFNSDEFNLYLQWVEKEHIGKQMMSRKSYSIGRESFLDYIVPFKEKENVEITYWEKFKQFWDEIRGKIGYFKEGYNPDQDDDKTIWKNIKEKFTSLWAVYVSRSQTIEPESLYRDRSRRIPVIYTQYLEGEKVSDNIFAAVTEYVGSLNRANHIHKAMPLINGIKNTLEFNVPKNKRSKEYLRYKRIDDYLEQNIYRRGLPGNNIGYQALRLMRKVMVLKSQTILNPGGNFKNLMAGLISNYVHSLNPKGGLYLNKTRRDFVTTGEAFAWATKITNEKLKLQKEESLEYYLSRLLNPQGKDLTNLLKSDNRSTNYLKYGGFLYSGMEAGETVISYQLMLDIIRRVELFEEVNENGTTTYKPIKFEESWDQDSNGRWKIKDNIYKNIPDATTPAQLFSMSDVGNIQRLIKQGVFTTIGHSNDDKGAMFGNGLVGNAFFFMSFIIPLFQESFTTNRNDFISGRVIQNYHLALLNNMWKGLKYAKEGMNYWQFMTANEKRDTLRALVLYSWAIVMYLLVRLVLGYDPDDDDKFRELQDNNGLQNFLLYSALRTLSELEQQGIWQFTSKKPVPMVTENMDAILNPMIWKQFTKTLDVVRDGVTFAEYKKSNRKNGIVAGELKFPHEISKYFGFNLSERFDFANQIEQFVKMDNKN